MRRPAAWSLVIFRLLAAIGAATGAGLVFGYLYLLVRLRINPLKVFFRRY